MTANAIDIDSIHQTLIAAFLLTGSANRGEEALMHGLEFHSCDGAPVDAFIEKTIEFALAQKPFDVDRHESPSTDAFLPEELRRVVRLEPRLRSYFVLRTLLGLPPERCAALLGVDARCVDEVNGAAAVELARIACEETRTRVLLSNPPNELFSDPQNLYAIGAGAPRMHAACS